jgi:hypothetical protein
MAYEFSDFADNVFKELGKSGAIHPAELNDENLESVQLQGDYAIKAIDRLVAVRNAASDFHKLVLSAAAKGVPLDDEVFKAAESRLNVALAEAGVRVK